MWDVRVLKYFSSIVGDEAIALITVGDEAIYVSRIFGLGG